MAAARVSGGNGTSGFDPEIEQVFHEVADLTSRQRTDYYAAHLISDGVRDQVETLLAADGASSQLLDEVVRQQVGREINASSEAVAGELCGPYRLLKPIGHGGMGEVWLAERIDGLLKRPVALKLPHSGLQAWEFAHRSHRERDILAGLAHRGIARLYDAGLTERGRPFLVLEFIEGLALDRYCDERQLSIRARLALFIQVLEAVQYAHSHLVIHSDLKPSNILVTSEGEAKLLDFGIAKLVKTGEAPDGDVTLAATPAMTPGYAAPEQIAGQRVTTTCDVYSLGIVLFELISGRRPAGRKATDGTLGQPMLTARPSQAVTDIQKARQRGTTPKRLANSLRGDLDNITLKAIQEKPEKRYATADAFRSDLERYLVGEPVLARPESAWYRARKFIVRHKVAVAAAGSVLIAIAVGFSIALWEWQAAKREARTSAAVQEFIQDIFETNGRDQTDPMKARQTSARELLNIGSKKIDSSLNNAPEAKERMLAILESLYLDLGLYDQAVTLGKKRVVVAKQTYGVNDARVADALTDLGATLHASSSVSEREKVLLEAKQILDGKHDWNSLRRAKLCSLLSQNYQSTDRKKGLGFAEEAVALYRQMPPPSDDLAAALVREGMIYSYNDEDEKAEPLFTEAVAIAKQRSGNLEGNLPVYASSLGETNETLMHFSAASENLQLAWNTAVRLTGEDSVDSIETESRLGKFYGDTGRYGKSIAFLRHATENCVRTKGADDPFFTPQMFFQYGEVLGQSGRLKEGLDYVSRAVENRRKNRPGTRYLAQMLASQALLLAQSGENQKAQELLKEADVISRKVGFSIGKRSVAAQIILAFNSDNPNGAKDFIESGFGAVDKSSPISMDLLRSFYWRAELAILNNDADGAAGLSKRGMDLIAASGLGEYLNEWKAHYLLEQGRAYLLRGDGAAGIPILKRAVQLEMEIYDPASPDVAVAQAALASGYLDLGDRNEAVKLQAQAEAIERLHPKLGQFYRRPIEVLRSRLLPNHQNR